MDRIAFETEDGLRLEGEIREPEGPVLASAVLCHAHPQHGGSKDHPLLWAIRNDLAARGFAVLSFNFRGVMGSEGVFGGGAEELADVEAAVRAMLERHPGGLLVGGWSFGAHTALRVAVRDKRISALALLGFPLAESSLVLPPLPSREDLAGLSRPVLLVAGEADPFCPLPDLRRLARRIPRATMTVMKGTDHFFWRREREAASLVGAFGQQALNRSEKE
jgi:alpha/beta superfamily hydrolase